MTTFIIIAFLSGGFIGYLMGKNNQSTNNNKMDIFDLEDKLEADHLDSKLKRLSDKHNSFVGDTYDILTNLATYLKVEHVKEEIGSPYGPISRRSYFRPIKQTRNTKRNA